MRNLKKILAVICVVAMLASIAIVPALAAGFANEAQATTLNTLGVMAGMNLGDEVTRIQGLTFAIKAAGKDAAAQALTQAEVDAALANVVDASDIPAWGQKYAAYAVLNSMTTGVDASIAPKIKFAATQAISGDSFLVWLLRSMGYTTVGTANAWEVAVTDAKVLTLSQGYAIHGAAKLIRDDVAGVLYGAVDNGVCKDGKAFVDTLIAAGMFTQQQAADAGLSTPPAPKALAVASMTGDNLKAVKIVFTVPVDKDTITTTNISNADSSGQAISAVSVSDDKTTVWAVLANAVTQNTKVQVKVKDVKDAAGNKITESTTDVYMKDLAVPTISGVTVVDAKNLEILASEPINYLFASNSVLSNIKIDGISPIGTTSFDYVNNKLKVSLATALTANTHNVEIKDMTDFSSLKAITTTYTIAVAEDKTAPAIASVEYKSNTQIVVSFNETLSDKGSFKVDGTAPTTTTLDGKKVTLDLAGKLDIGAVVQVKVEYKDQKDVVGNKVADWTTFTFTVADDTTLPTVAVAVGDANKLTFTFSKAMTQNGGEITVKDKDGLNKGTVTLGVTAGCTWKDSNKTLEVTGIAALTNIDSANFTLVLDKFKDSSIRENAMPKTELAITAKDTKKPTVTAGYVNKDNSSDRKKDTVTFYFSEAMDSATAQNLSNYIKTNGGNVSLATIADVSVKEFASDGKSITIYYPGAGDTVATDGVLFNDTFQILGIKDVAGNWVDTTAVTKNNTTAIGFAGAADYIKATAANKIEVYFDNSVKTVDPSAFVVQKTSDGGTTWVDYSSFSAFEIKNDATGGASAYRVTFTLVNDLDVTSTTAYRLAKGVNETVESIYGTKFDTSAMAARAITDAIAPVVKEVTADDGRIITVKFSEEVTAADVTALLSSMVVVDPDGNVIGVGAKLTGITYFVGDTASTIADFNKIKLQFAAGQENKAYKVSFLSRAGSIVDLVAPTPNVIKSYAETSLTLKQ